MGCLVSRAERRRLRSGLGWGAGTQRHQACLGLSLLGMSLRLWEAEWGAVPSQRRVVQGHVGTGVHCTPRRLVVDGLCKMLTVRGITLKSQVEDFDGCWLHCALLKLVLPGLLQEKLTPGQLRGPDQEAAGLRGALPLQGWSSWAAPHPTSPGFL